MGVHCTGAHENSQGSSLYIPHPYPALPLIWLENVRNLACTPSCELLLQGRATLEMKVSFKTPREDGVDVRTAH